MSYQPQVVILAASSPGRPISKWWWIGLLISWIIFLIIAGVLVTANCITCSELNASFACFAIAGALHLAFWIVLIVWCTQRRRKHASPQKFIPQQFIPQPAPAPIYSSPPPQGATTASSDTQEMARFCGNCGMAATARFCAECGTQV